MMVEQELIWTESDLQELLDRLGRVEQALVTFASAAGAPDQYRQVLLDLGIAPPEPVATNQFQKQANR